MTDLIDRLSAAAEGPRELDMAICKALPGPMKLAQGPDGARWPDYSTSVDAALPWENIVMSYWRDGMWHANHSLTPGQVGPSTEGIAKTEALARRIAALKARED